MNTEKNQDRELLIELFTLVQHVKALSGIDTKALPGTVIDRIQKHLESVKNEKTEQGKTI